LPEDRKLLAQREIFEREDRAILEEGADEREHHNDG